MQAIEAPPVNTNPATLPIKPVIEIAVLIHAFFSCCFIFLILASISEINSIKSSKSFRTASIAFLIFSLAELISSL